MRVYLKKNLCNQAGGSATCTVQVSTRVGGPPPPRESLQNDCRIGTFSFGRRKTPFSLFERRCFLYFWRILLSARLPRVISAVCLNFKGCPRRFLTRVQAYCSRCRTQFPLLMRARAWELPEWKRLRPRGGPASVAQNDQRTDHSEKRGLKYA